MTEALKTVVRGNADAAIAVIRTRNDSFVAIG
jgi:hypothetical protein